MKNVLGVILVAFWCISMLSGCAASRVMNDTDEADLVGASYARKVINAAGMPDIEDVEVALTEEMIQQINYKGRASTAEKVSYTLFHALSSDSTLGLAGLLLDGPAWGHITKQVDNRSIPQILAWMPQEDAADAKQAMARLKLIVNEAVDDVLAETDFPSPYKVITPEDLNGDEPWCKITIIGAPFSQACRLAIYYAADGRSWFASEKAKALVPSPDFVESKGQSWLFYDLGTTMEVFARDDLPSLRLLPILQKVSARLPAWLYIYMPPSNTGKGGLKITSPQGALTKAPFVLNQGNMHFFAKVKK